MVKRKPQYVKIKEYIIQNIEDEKYNENEQIESEHALCELWCYPNDSAPSFNRFNQ